MAHAQKPTSNTLKKVQKGSLSKEFEENRRVIFETPTPRPPYPTPPFSTFNKLEKFICTSTRGLHGPEARTRQKEK